MKFNCPMFSHFAFFLLLLASLCGAQARDTGTDPSATIEREIQTIVVNADGSYSKTHEQAVRINEQRAIGGNAQRYISYNRTLDEVEVTLAYTEKPDGRKVMVQPDQIKDQQEARSNGAPMFQDTRLKVVIFPEVSVGDLLVLHYKKVRNTALFPGNFEDLIGSSFFIVKQQRLIYDLPETLPLHADARGYAGTSLPAAAGRKRYQWDYIPSERQRQEHDAVSYLDYGSRLAVSTFADFRLFARAYDARASDKTAVTPKIRALAAKITRGISDPRAQAHALANWVRARIRYVAVYIGAGGVVPHSADLILENLYGDCKDHVTLLEALLTSVGLESTPALINLGNSYQLMKVPTLGIMNHVITYIPSLKLYLDSTADSIAAGYLPNSELDKPVLLTRSGSIGRTPARQTGEIVNSGVFKLQPSGAADFSSTTTVRGWGAEVNRYGLRSLKQADRDMFVERLLKQRGQKGAGTLELGNLASAGDEYKFSFKGRSEDMALLPGPIGLPTSSGFSGGLGSMVGSLDAEKERTQDFICHSGRYVEETQFIIPKEISIVALPKPLFLQDSYIDYRADYVRQDDGVLVRHELDFHHDGSICSVADAEAMRPSVDRIMRDMRSQIIIQGE